MMPWASAPARNASVTTLRAASALPIAASGREFSRPSLQGLRRRSSSWLLGALRCRRWSKDGSREICTICAYGLFPRPRGTSPRSPFRIRAAGLFAPSQQGALRVVGAQAMYEHGGRADQALGLSAGERRKSSKSCMYLHISSKRRSPRRSRQCCSISATRLPASCLAAARGGKDQLGAPVDGIWPALEVTEPLQIADEFGSGGQAQERPGRQVREPYAVDAHVAEDLQMGFA